MKKVDAMLRQRGFKFSAHPQASPFDGSYRRGPEQLVVEVKAVVLYRAREFRAMVGDAILRFQASKQDRSTGLLLAIQFGRMGRGAEADLKEYAGRFLPGLRWILASQDGAARLHLAPGDDESIPGEPSPGGPLVANAAAGARSLFSPKGQWLWKSLLLPGIGARYWAGPDTAPRTVTELAERSGVSQPVVSSFVGRAETAGFLKRGGGRLTVVNHRELLEDWAHVLKSGRRQALGVRSLHGDAPEAELLERVREYCRKASGASARPPVVVGFHLACHLLGLGRSNQRAAQLHVATASAPEVMDALELVPAADGAVSLALIADDLPDSVHRGCVMVEGVPVADALQCYLDVRPSYARGREQADFIFERVLRPHFERP